MLARTRGRWHDGARRGGRARGGRVRVRTALSFAAAGAVGAVAGTAFHRLASSEIILALLLLLLLAAAYGMVRRPDAEGVSETAAHGRGLWLAVVPAGLGVGVLTGFFGVGQGFAVLVAAVAVLVLVESAAGLL